MYGGYIDLHSIIRTVFTILMEETLELKIPNKFDANTISLNVKNIIIFDHGEYLRGTQF